MSAELDALRDRLREQSERADYAEARAQVFEARIRAIADAVICTRDGRIIYVNPEAEIMFGYGTAEMIGKDIEILVPGALRHTHAKQRTVYEAQPSRRLMGGPGIEIQGVRRDGSTFPADISLGPRRTEGGVEVVAVIRDVTKRRYRFAEAIAAKESALAATGKPT